MRWLVKSFLGLFDAEHASVNQVGRGEKVYSGRFHSGKAKYYYDEGLDERILNGSFEYKELHGSFPFRSIKLRIFGAYVDSMKNSMWLFETNHHDRYKKLDVEYEHGIHEGVYNFSCTRNNTSSMMPDGNDFLKMTMHSGHPVGRIVGNVNGGKFEGFCDADGFPDGKWSLDFTSPTSSDVYCDEWEHGVLKKKYTLDMSTGKKRPRNESLVKYLSRYVLQECYGLEKTIQKGAHVWDGTIAVKSDEE